MLVIAANPILPPWLVLPAAAATMLVIAAHILLMPTLQMPASRRRIRTVNGFLMLFATAMLAYGFGLATESAPRTFVIVWTAIIVLLAVIVVLAFADVANTVRLGMAERRSIHQGMREDLHQQVAQRVAARLDGARGGGERAAEETDAGR